MLPTIEYTKDEIELCLTGKKILMRPMTIAEEKVLLTARESGEPTTIIRAIVQILDSCIEGSIKVMNLPLFQVEWLFMNLRRISVSNIVKLQYTPEEGDAIPFEVDLNKIKMKVPKKMPSATVLLKINEKTISIKLKHTPVSHILEVGDDNAIDKILVGSIDSVSVNDEVMIFDSYSEEEKLKWIETLPAYVMETITEFVNTVPVLEHKQKVNGEEITISGIFDFFQL